MPIELFEALAKGALRRSAPYSHAVNDASYTVLEANQAQVQRGGIVVSGINYTITILTTGLYVTTIGLNGSFPGAEEANLTRFINGAPSSFVPIKIQGQGSNNETVSFWQSTGTYQAGDVVDLRIINGASGNFSLNVNRISFAIEADG